MSRFGTSLSFVLLACLQAPTFGQVKGSSVKATIAGGPNAGTYTLESSEPCEIQAATGQGARILKVAVGEVAKLANPKTLGIAIFEIPLAATYPSPAIDITLAFGPIDNPVADYYVMTLTDEKEGIGTVTVTERGATATLSFQAETAEGVKFQGVLECHEVRLP